MATAQPPWHAPAAHSDEVTARLPRLSVYNSLTRSKTPFVPLDREGRKVTWYACGPTVYDDSHLGHARNYVSTDIIRRILQNYFKFDVRFVMNITDVDDKIILAARQQHLLGEWVAKHKDVSDEVRQTTTAAFNAYIAKNLPLLAIDTTPASFTQESERLYGHVIQGKSVANDGTPPGDKEAKVKMHLKTSSSAAAVLNNEVDFASLITGASGVLLPYIDSLHSTEVSGSDHAIFTKLTKKYEQRFFDDMRALNVQEPDEITRVTEYGPPIVDFVKQIQDNGFAYEHEGSVYYDVGHWEKAGGVYARLEPWNRNDKELQADGEGSLSTKKTAFKRSGADFALWKASKPGEPSWPSPWGEGRPGWHIECSAMASKILGNTFDIHSGGIDLAFPHHDNELAQSEAYWCKPAAVADGKQWVNYFIHMGHLSIQGSKMSKSLKNFTTIREALAKGDWTPRGLRIVFLLGAWRDGLEITTETIKAGVAWEERVNNFFIKVRDIQSRQQLNGTGGSDALLKTLEDAKSKLHDALCDSFDTPAALRVITDLLTAYNSAKHVPDHVSISTAQWVTEIVSMLGLDAAYQPGQLGWSGLDVPAEALKIVKPLAQLRDTIREQAIAGKIDPSSLSQSADFGAVGTVEQPYAEVYSDLQGKIEALTVKDADPKQWLALCDYVRDDSLWNVGIYLEDREGQPALIRPLSASLRQERKDREAQAVAKAAAKAKAKADAEAAEKEKLEKGKLSHLEMFRTSEYAEWDSDGLPVKDAEGKEVAKSKSKKLKKDWERQKKLHEAYLAASK
ncbi:hypothetical protein AMS68_007057 [Peltaster fructicola]|uniref:cysteine--tRNA ligase n=1 Tax=Peltaster fructicola TaxID=286661 RepID=A0A6H0Y4K6_9PEZI|nr:hypothetical protein AMS68_007057 [Peltaster fructicola]